MMDIQELKPCPFCGNEAVSIQSEPDHPEYGSGGRFYYVRCPSCRAQSGSKYAHEVCAIFYSEVRQEWNNRFAPPAPFVVKGFPKFIEVGYTFGKCESWVCESEGYNSGLEAAINAINKSGGSVDDE